MAALLVGEGISLKPPHIKSHHFVLCSWWPALGGREGSCHNPTLQLEKLRLTTPAE